MTGSPARTLLLLAAALGEPGAPVLSAGECRRMESWLRRVGAGWAALPEAGTLDRLAATAPPPLPAPRLRSLLARTARLDEALSAWTAAGFVPVDLFDDTYPRRLKRRLGDDAPPVLLRRGPAAAANRGGTLLFGLPDDAATEALRNVEPLLLVAGDRLARAPAAGTVPLLIAAAAEAAPPAVPALVLPDAASADAAPLLLALGLSDTAVFGSEPPPLLPPLVRALDEQWQPVWLHPADTDRPSPLRALGARTLPAALPSTAASLSRFLRTDPAPRPAPSNPLPPSPRPQLVSPGFAEAPSPFGTASDLPPPRLRSPAPLRVVPGGAPTSTPTSTPGSTPASTPAPPAAPARDTDDADASDPLFTLFLRLLPPLLRHGPLGAAPIAAALRLDRVQLRIWLLRAEHRGLLRHDPATATWTLGTPSSN